MCWTTHFDLLASTAAIPEARRQAMQGLTGHAADLADSDVLWDLQLLLSEMVTNAVQAGSARVEVDIRLHSDRVQINVSDDAAGWPDMRIASETDTSGRGLAIVAAMASDWGVAKIDNGKTVWLVLPIPDTITTPAGCRF